MKPFRLDKYAVKYKIRKGTNAFSHHCKSHAASLISIQILDVLVSSLLEVFITEEPQRTRTTWGQRSSTNATSIMVLLILSLNAICDISLKSLIESFYV
uniref:Uncharacterized protein n=1 Tax=Anguilla anguilla TaxID=7936 RepID=A0A0E9W9Q8_ANGAN